MYWLILMFTVIIFIGLQITKRDRTARQNFLDKYSKEGYESGMSEIVKEYIQNGQKIQAIKQFRTETGLGLKDAKEIICLYDIEHTK